MLLIFGMSTPTGSSANTRPVVKSILKRLFPAIGQYLSPKMIDQTDYAIRKAAHLTEYAIFGFLAYRAFRFGRADFRHLYPLGAFLLGVGYAASDEFHQSFYPEREASPVDVLIDSMGVIAGVGVSLWRHCTHLQGRLNRTTPLKSPSGELEE